MTYNKPEISHLGDATSVIHGIGKVKQVAFEPLFPTFAFAFIPAYDLDE